MKMSAKTKNISKILYASNLACLHLAIYISQCHTTFAKAYSHGCGIRVFVKRHPPMAYCSRQGLHARKSTLCIWLATSANYMKHHPSPACTNNVVCTSTCYLRCLLSASTNKHCIWSMQIIQETSANGRKSHQRSTQISHGMFAFSQRYQSLPARIWKGPSTNHMNHQPRIARISCVMCAFTRWHWLWHSYIVQVMSWNCRQHQPSSSRI